MYVKNDIIFICMLQFCVVTTFLPDFNFKKIYSCVLIFGKCYSMPSSFGPNFWEKRNVKYK